jgi:hypothetical protein
MLGQLASFGGKEITLDIASLVIPPGYGSLASHLMATWASRDHAASLAEARKLADDGVPLVPFFDDLIEEVRKMLVASGEAPQPFTPGELNDIALMLFERRKDAKSGIDPLFALQLAGTFVANGLLKHASRNAHLASADDTRYAIQETREVPKAQEKIKAHIEPTVIPSVVEGSRTAEIPPLASLGRNDEQKPTPHPEEGAGGGAMLELNTVRAKWAAIIRKVDEMNHSLPFILKIARPESISGHAIVIRFQYPFHMDKVVGDPKNRQIVEEAARSVLGQPALTIEGLVGEDPGRAEARSQDIVTNILKAFGGQVVES